MKRGMPVQQPPILYQPAETDKYYNPPAETGKYYNPPLEGSTYHEAPNSTDSAVKNSPRRPFYSRKRYYLGAIIIVIIVVAATVGGVIGARNSRQANEHSPATPAGSPTSTASGSSPTIFSPPGSTGSPSPSTVNNAWAMNGTSLFAFTFSTTKDTTGTNYILFYQHSNGDIRQAIHNNSQWNPSEFITHDAHPRTGLAAFWLGTFEYTLFYVDKNNILQEIRGSQGSNTWLNGTLGQLSIQVADASDALSVVYVGSCFNVNTAWLIFSPANSTEQNQAQIVYWNGNTDTWSLGDPMADVNPSAGFVAHENLDMWRYYYVSKSNSQLKELICPNCCSSSSPSWTNGMSDLHICMYPTRRVFCLVLLIYSMFECLYGVANENTVKISMARWWDHLTVG